MFVYVIYVTKQEIWRNLAKPGGSVTPIPYDGGTKKNGLLAKKVKSLGKSPRESPLVERR